jgi:hypothetical protein
LNLSLYNKYNGEFLSTEDKEDILDAIGGDSVEGSTAGRFDAPAVRVGSIGFGTRTFAGASMKLDKDFVDLVFFGNELNRRYKLLNSGTALAYTSFGVSYGRAVAQPRGWLVLGGVSLKYVAGWAAAKVVESRGNVLTESSGVSGWGESRIRESDGTGRGLALDLGAWAANARWECGAVLRELGPALRWPGGTEESYSFEIDGWTLEGEDSLYSEEKHTRDVGRWFSPLPTSLEAAGAYHTSWGVVSLQWIQGLRETAGMTTTPRVQTAVSWEATRWLRPWLGLEMGAPEGLSLPLGTELWVSPVRFDVALTGCRVPPSHGKALGFVLSIGLSPT